MSTLFLRSFLCLAAMLCGAVWCDDTTQDPRCPTALPHTAALRVHADACYQFVDVEKYWTEARDFCQHWGGRLVKVDDSATGEFIVSTLNALPWKSNGVWIGLHDRDKELHWQWTGPGPNTNEDGLHWSNWGSGHPKAFLHSQRDCVRMVRGKGEWKWHETPCALFKWHYRFICEYQMKPTVPPPQPPPVSSRFFHPDSAHNRRVTETPPSPLTSPQPPPSTEAPSSAGEVKESKGVHWGLRGGVTKSVERTIEPTSVEDRVLYADGMGYVLQMKSDEEKQESNGGRIAAAVSVTVFGVAVLLLVIFLLYRRRREREDKLSTVAVVQCDSGSPKEKRTMLKGDLEEDEEEGGKGEKTPRPFWTKLMRAPPLVAMTTKRPSPPAQNTYVDAPLRATVRPKSERNTEQGNDSNVIGGRSCQSKLPTLPTASGPAYYPQVGGESVQSRSEKCCDGKNASSEEGSETEKANGRGKFLIDCDASNYDSPKPANVYAEIPGQELEQEEGDECHIYECLDDMKGRVNVGSQRHPPAGGDSDVVA